MTTKNRSLLAFDIGAESGRAIIGHLSDGRIELEEIHRFASSPIQIGDSLHIDVLGIWKEMLAGLQKAGANSVGADIASVGVDTWGVDYALLDRYHRLIGAPFHYRDRRTDGMIEKVVDKIPGDALYRSTGNQFVQFNSIFQLAETSFYEPETLERAAHFLMLPDLFHFWLSSERTLEYTASSTSQCFNQLQQDWAWDVLDVLKIPKRLFTPVSPPATAIGNLSSWVRERSGLSRAQVILPPSHDTASAVTAIPVMEPDFLYISSGTWSLVGVELDQPKIDLASYHANITNEGTAGGKTCYLKIVPGMWLLQQCRQRWKLEGHAYTYDDLTCLAEGAGYFHSLINVNDPVFLSPGDMPNAIRNICQDSGQPLPESHGEFVRCILESIACNYVDLLRMYERVLGKTIRVIHIIGGGSQNRLLNQLTANVTGKPVVAGPVETTAIGNLLVQAIGLGEVSSVAEIREIVRNSFELRRFEPDTAAAPNAFARYQMLFQMKSEGKMKKPE